MSFWTAAVIIVAIGALSAMYRERLKARAQRSEDSMEGLSRRIRSLEDRMASLETIVLEKERARHFSGLEDNDRS